VRLDQPARKKDRRTVVIQRTAGRVGKVIQTNMQEVDMFRCFRSAIFALGTIALGTTAAQGGTKKDIVDTAVSAGSFSTLVSAVKAAGLVDALKGDGPFTVFAPTDAAFAKLPADTIEDLLKPEKVKTSGDHHLPCRLR
jgi:hypothetical protein